MSLSLIFNLHIFPPFSRIKRKTVRRILLIALFHSEINKFDDAIQISKKNHDSAQRFVWQRKETSG